MKPDSELRELKKILDGITSHVKNTVAQCIAAGKLLTQIKSKTKHGDWKRVLESVELTFKTAQRYMSLWEHRAELNLKEIKTLTDAEITVSKIGSLPISTTQNEPLKGRVDTFNETLSKVTNHAPKRFIASEAKPTKEPEIRLDKVGRPIPEDILVDWDRAHDMGTRLRSMVSEVKCTLQKGLEAERDADKDLVFRELSNSVISEAEALHYSLSQIVPHAVCPTCQGKTRSHCRTCRQRGFISKFYWDGPTIGKDVRNIIIKQYASQAISA